MAGKLAQGNAIWLMGRWLGASEARAVRDLQPESMANAPAHQNLQLKPLIPCHLLRFGPFSF